MGLYRKKDKLLLMGAVLLGGISAGLSAFISILLQRIIDAAVNQDQSAFSNLFGFTVIYLVVLGGMGFLEAYCGKLLVRNVTEHLRKDIFKGVLSRRPVEYASRNTADYLSALVNDVKLVEENYLVPFLLCCQLAALFLTTLGILFYLSPAVTGVLLVLMVLMFLVPVLMGKHMQKKQDAYSEKAAEFTAETKDYLNGYEVIRSYSMYRYIFKKFKKVNKETAGKKFAADAMLAVNESFSDILSAMTVLAIVFLSSYLLLKGQISAGTLLALIQLSSTFVTPVVLLMQNVPKITSMKPVIEHLQELMALPEDAEIAGEKTAAFPARLTEGVRCENVTFGYGEGRAILEGVDMHLEAGKKYALLGDSGSGKSTLIKLLTGYTKDFSGDIYYDGVSVRTLAQGALNKKAATIHQNVFLFNTDIYDNICLGESFTYEEVERALIDSGVMQFLPELEEGLDTAVEENGQNLSGGQRQRIAVARALIRHTPLLIIDEGTSAVDRHTAFEIEQKLLQQKDLTVLVITHHMDERLLEYYDDIFTLENGTLLAAG